MDIDWDKQEMLVQIGKDRPSRWAREAVKVPIFADLMPFIEDAQRIVRGQRGISWFIAIAMRKATCGRNCTGSSSVPS